MCGHPGVGRTRLQVLDRRVIATLQQGDPVIVGADVHAEVAVEGLQAADALLRHHPAVQRRGVFVRGFLDFSVGRLDDAGEIGGGEGR